ncbi:MAG: hypothetical protein F7C09_02550 [Aeropyrum sp.]|nr:hypothetical protein [Aeropyrum sp.]
MDEVFEEIKNLREEISRLPESRRSMLMRELDLTEASIRAARLAEEGGDSDAAQWLVILSIVRIDEIKRRLASLQRDGPPLRTSNVPYVFDGGACHT